MKSDINNNQRNKLIVVILISLFLHCAILGALFFIERLGSDGATGEQYVVVSVDVFSSRDENERLSNNASTIKEKETSKTIVRSKTAKNSDGSSNTKQGGKNLSSTGTIGTPGVGGKDQTLTKIRKKIERVKEYPRMAMRKGLEGRPTVLFEINSDGSIKYVRISRSSGQDIIDNAALSTVKRAAPLPYYKGPITTALVYELR